MANSGSHYSGSHYVDRDHKAKRNTETKIAFPGAMLGLAISPWETTQILLSEKRPKYIFIFLILLILVLFGPSFYYLGKYGQDSFQPDRIFSLYVIFGVFLLLYFLFQCLYLFVLGIEFTFLQMAAVVVYSLTPFISLVLIIYAFHYLGSHNFSFFTPVAQGNFPMPQAYANILPYLIIITELSVYFILSFSIRALAEGQLITALIFGGLALAALALAALCTAYLADIFSPGAKFITFRIIDGLFSVWGI